MRLRCLILLLILALLTASSSHAALVDDPNRIIRGQDEPQLTSWRVLEGVTEPYEEVAGKETLLPVWKQLKIAADHKAANMAIQAALSEYGQLIRHPVYFGDMPMDERHDIFLSMSKLLKIMGFDQRAELLLYEAMSYTTQPYEAHLQLGLLALDKEDINKATMHLKNCLFYRENNVLILSHLAVVLIVEGKTHEAKFFISRLLGVLERRVDKLKQIMNVTDAAAATTATTAAVDNGMIDHAGLVRWLEDLLQRAFSSSLRITSATTLDMFSKFSTLYKCLSMGEVSGRLLFDMGQALHESGRPAAGRMMMVKGHATSDVRQEGQVSINVIELRLALDFPIVPHDLFCIIEAYLNVTDHLVRTASSYTAIELENLMDVYFPIPSLGWSALPTATLVCELLWRFEDQDGSDKPLVRRHALAQQWLLYPDQYRPPSSLQLNDKHFEAATRREERKYAHGAIVQEEDWEDELVNNKINNNDDDDGNNNNKNKADNKDEGDGWIDVLVGKKKRSVRKKRSTLEDQGEGGGAIEVGILGGHMNSHSVGQMVLHHLLALKQQNQQHHHHHHQQQQQQRHDYFRLTLLAMPLVPDTTTKRIAKGVDAIVNLPADLTQAWAILDQLQLDVLLIPDWQPHPDQQHLVLLTRRIAPVQICFFVRGGGCLGGGAGGVDYYILPQELLGASGVARDEERGGWKEAFSEQVVFLDWPILTASIIHAVARNVHADVATLANTLASRGGRSNSNSNKMEGEEAVATAVVAAGLDFAPLQEEGQVFFSGQPTAVMALHPSQLHPLMDELLFKLLHAAPTLQLVLALPDIFFTHGGAGGGAGGGGGGGVGNGEGYICRSKMSWAKRLVRRLWTRGGGLHHRIRLLPFPLSEMRLLQLFRQADVVLDTFPIGGFFHIHALALSVGTPVVTMRPNSQMHTPKEELKALRTLLLQAATPEWHSNPLYIDVMTKGVPWLPTQCSLSHYYAHVELQEQLVANSTQAYFGLVRKIVADREYAYQVRVHLLDTLDEFLHHDVTGGGAGAAGAGGGGGGGAAVDNGGEEDLSFFIRQVASPFAMRRRRAQRGKDYWSLHHFEDGKRSRGAETSSSQKRVFAAVE